MRITTIVLARKGSKRIPNKNMKLFNGKPLIHYTLECAEKLGYPVYFFSDCVKMRDYAAQFDINIRIKPEKYAQDVHRTGEELREYNEKIKADVIVNLQVTSPVRNYETVKKWIQDFVSQKNFSCGMSVYRLPRKFFYMDGYPLNFDLKERDYNGCEVEDMYYENGSFYIFKKEMLNKKHFLQHPVKMYPDSSGIELDYEWQWNPAELYFKQIKGIKNEN